MNENYVFDDISDPSGNVVGAFSFSDGDWSKYPVHGKHHDFGSSGHYFGHSDNRR